VARADRTRVHATYFHGTEIRSKLKKGEPFLSTTADGTKMVDGEVLECDPPKKLVHTWRVHWDPALTHELSKVSYVIERAGENCKGLRIAAAKSPASLDQASLNLVQHYHRWRAANRCSTLSRAQGKGMNRSIS
jgi:uncharacterized protein YndB with AHSA1/START domain